MIFDLNRFSLIIYEYLLKNGNSCFDLISYIRSGAFNSKGRKDPNIGRDGITNMSIELPRSAIIVLDRLTSEGPLTPKAISSRVDLAPRTVSFALRKLLGQSLCKKIPNLSDMRQPLYAADMERAKALRSRFEHVFRQVLV